MCMYMYVYMCVYIYIDRYTYTHLSLSIYIYIYTYTCTYITYQLIAGLHRAPAGAAGVPLTCFKCIQLISLHTTNESPSCLYKARSF